MSSRQSFRRWGGPNPEEDALSLVALVEAGTLDPRLASLLWLAVEHKASLIVAAAPRLAGKTTLLNAVMGFAPPWYEFAHTRGAMENFAFLRRTDPTRTYILVNEISDHLPVYLWGDGVQRVFEAMGRGYSLGATMHADTPEEVLDTLLLPPLAIPVHQVANLHLVVTLWMGERGAEVVRRVSGVWLVLPGESGKGPPGVLRLARWAPAQDSFRHTDSEEARRSLGRRLGLEAGALGPELGSREGFLGELSGAGVRKAALVRQHVLAYYQGKGTEAR